MATCEKRRPAPVPADYVLTLTEDEAHYLASLLHSVACGESPHAGISEALEGAGAERATYRFTTLNQRDMAGPAYGHRTA